MERIKCKSAAAAAAAVQSHSLNPHFFNKMHIVEIVVSEDLRCHYK